MPVWHCSVAALPTRPVASWRPAQRREAERIAFALISGVGRKGHEFFEDRVHEHEAVALHLRRPATVDEEWAVGGARDTRCDHGKGLILL